MHHPSVKNSGGAAGTAIWKGGEGGGVGREVVVGGGGMPGCTAEQTGQVAVE